MALDEAVSLSFARAEGDRVLRDLGARGLTFASERGRRVVLAAPDVRPTLAHLEIEADAVTVSIRRPSPLKPKHAKRSSRVADQRLSEGLYAEALKASALPVDQRADRLVALLAGARSQLIGSDGIQASRVVEMRGRSVRGGLPGLGRRR